MQMQMEGLRLEFPEYYAQIRDAIERCFRRLNRSSGNPVAILRFEIAKDGTIPRRSIEVHRRSGNGVFDSYAFQSVECAGDGAIGPLPPEMSIDILPVELTFRPL
jgi:hypothetical protein